MDNQLPKLVTCVLALLREREAQLADHHVAYSLMNLTLTALHKQDGSLLTLVDNSTSLCAQSLDQLSKTDSGHVAKLEQSVSSFEIMPMVLLVLATCLTCVISLHYHFTRGRDSAEYQYTLTESGSFSNTLRSSLLNQNSLISLVSNEEVPSSLRLLYPNESRASRQTQTYHTPQYTPSSIAFSEDEDTFQDEQVCEGFDDPAKPEYQSSIFSHPALNVWWKASVPVLLSVTIAFYISAQCSSSIQAEFEIWFKGEQLLVIPVTDFNLFASFRDMLKAQVYLMAGIILVWSGIWPYIRQGLLLFCWFSPTSVLPLRRRATLIHVLDITGKWCLVNLFSSTLMGVAFAFHVSTDTISVLNRLLPNHFLQCQVKLQVTYGSYANIFATILSLIAGHITIYFHRCTLASDETREFHFNTRWDDANIIHGNCGANAARDETQLFQPAMPVVERQLHGNEYSSRLVVSWLDYGSTDELVRESLRSHFQKCRPTWETPVVDAIVTVLLPLTLAFIVYASMASLFSFHFGGLIGRLLGIVDPTEINSQQSIVSTVLEIGIIGSDGAVFLEVFLLLITTVLPLIHVTLLAVLWFVPFTLKQQKIVYTLQEICAAWVSLDVFLVNTVASVLQLQKFTKWTVGNHCPKNVDCFAVTSSWEPNAWAVFVALFLWYATDRLVSSKADHVILHRERWVERLHG